MASKNIYNATNVVIIIFSAVYMVLYACEFYVNTDIKADVVVTLLVTIMLVDIIKGLRLYFELYEKGILSILHNQPYINYYQYLEYRQEEPFIIDNQVIMKGYKNAEEFSNSITVLLVLMKITKTLKQSNFQQKNKQTELLTKF